MNIAILDDSKEDLQQIRNVVSSYYESRNTQANIRLFSSAESFFKKYSPGVYDLVIMDIYMDTMTGMDAARKLREADDPAALIFITSSDSYAVESYDVRASYYLLKPFDPENYRKSFLPSRSGSRRIPATLNWFLTALLSEFRSAVFFMWTLTGMRSRYIRTQGSSAPT